MPGCHALLGSLLSLSLVVVATPALAAQETPPATLHVVTQLVLVDVSVEMKRTGKPLPGLAITDFAVTEDNQPELPTTLSKDTLPLSLVFLFDLTDTVHPVIQHLANGAADVLRHLRPDDEVAVMTFSSHTHLEQRFTRDRMSAIEGIDAASASYDRQEPTFIFEDLWQASRQSSASRNPEARRIQVWVTDGSANDQDTQRYLAHQAPPVVHGEPEATAELLHSGAVISALIEKSSLRGNGRSGDLERLAALTGGPVVFATQSDASTRFGALLDSLRARYTLGYRPSQAKPAGTLCRLHVALSQAFWSAHPGMHPGDLTVRARQSYLR